MRIVKLATAALLACAAWPALAQDGTNAPGAVAPPQDAQTPPAAPAAPSVTPQPATPTAPGLNPPKAEARPSAPSAAEIVPGAAKPPATAETAAPSMPPPGPPSRFVFNRVDAGYLRLDNQNGQVAFCSRHAAGWVCQAVPEDRAALEKEIARLQDEVAGLKSEVAALREPPRPPRPPGELTPRSSDRNEDSKQLREDFARARTAIENAWRRLVEMIVNLQKDMMRKG